MSDSLLNDNADEPSASRSLLATLDSQPQQLSLLDCDPELVKELTKGKAGQFTAELLFERDVEKYKLIVTALAGGLSIRKMAKALRVSPGTITAVRDREGLSIGAQKGGIVRLLQQFAAAGAERLLEELHDIPIDKLPVALGIVIDKMQLLAGEATSRHEEKRTVSFDDYSAMLAQLGEPGVTGPTKQEENSKAEIPAAPLILDAEQIGPSDQDGEPSSTTGEQVFIANEPTATPRPASPPAD